MASVNYCSNVKYFSTTKITYHSKIKMKNEKKNIYIYAKYYYYYKL